MQRDSSRETSTQQRPMDPAALIAQALKRKFKDRIPTQDSDDSGEMDSCAWSLLNHLSDRNIMVLSYKHSVSLYMW